MSPPSPFFGSQLHFFARLTERRGDASLKLTVRGGRAIELDKLLSTDCSITATVADRIDCEIERRIYGLMSRLLSWRLREIIIGLEDRS